jgi:hypothetical protein
LASELDCFACAGVLILVSSRERTSQVQCSDMDLTPQSKSCCQIRNPERDRWTQGNKGVTGCSSTPNPMSWHAELESKKRISQESIRVHAND